MLESNTIKNLEDLKLFYLAQNSDIFFKEVADKKIENWEAVFCLLAEKEREEMGKRSLERRIKSSRVDLKTLKLMNKFDWKWPQKLDRNVIEDTFSMEFINKKQNLILVGKEGLGKTMIARNIAYQAILKGFSALFIDTAAMLNELAKQDSPRLLAVREKYYTSPDLIILDEFGYLSFDQRAADIMFKIINQRYQKGSIILTTNIGFKDWPQIFPGALCVPPMIDRLIHGCDIVEIQGSSYRFKEAKEAKARRETALTAKKDGKKA